jgi:hypothetical protein
MVLLVLGEGDPVPLAALTVTAAGPYEAVLAAARQDTAELDPARWHVLDLGAQPAGSGLRNVPCWTHHPRYDPGCADCRPLAATPHRHDAAPEEDCYCPRPGTYAVPRSDPVLAVFRRPLGEAVGRLREAQYAAALAAGDFPLDLTPARGDPGPNPYKVLRGSGAVTAHDTITAAGKAAERYAGPAAIYVWRVGLGEWHRYETVRDTWAAELPPGDGDDPARPWRLATLAGNLDYPDQAGLALAVAEMPGPFAIYEQRAETGRWHRTVTARGATP